ncbi:MAG: BrnT family toxin [Thermodesulfobacteriota bacterium]|jgi:hypothetical protein
MNDNLFQCTGFEWDDHNTEKLRARHGVAPTECEQIFFNRPFVVGDDSKHSEKENRFFVLGKTDTGRLLFLVFTVRSNRIRVISARDTNRKEREIYQAHEKENSSV